MTPALHKTAYNRAKTARAGAFAQLAGEHFFKFFARPLTNKRGMW